MKTILIYAEIKSKQNIHLKTNKAPTIEFIVTINYDIIAQNIKIIKFHL